MKKRLFFIICFVCFIFTTGCENDNDYIDFSEYQELNPQELHRAYIDNEIAAKDSYIDNYYYFTGKIYDIEQFLNDNYLTIRYKYNEDNTKIIEFNAYFKNEDDLKKIKKDDEITVYCKFKQRSIENYMDTVTSYSFHSCRIK